MSKKIDKTQNGSPEEEKKAGVDMIRLTGKVRGAPSSKYLPAEVRDRKYCCLIISSYARIQRLSRPTIFISNFHSVLVLNS